MVVIQQEVIAPALAAIRGGLSRSGTPIERSILLSASDGVMRVASNNAVFHVQTQIPVVGESFTVVVSGDLAEIVTRLAGPIAFTPKEKSLTVKANGTTLRLACIDPNAFLEPQQEEARVELTLPAAALCRALSVVEGVILTEDSRAFLNGALLEVTETQLTVVGSDGFTLAIARVEARASAGAKAILPTRAVREAIKVLRGAGDAAARLHVSDTKVELHCGALRLLARRVDSTFPDWKKVVSSLAADAVSVEVPRAAFAAALERLSVVVRSDSRVQLRGEPGKVTLCSSGAEQGAEDEVQATCASACEITLRRDQVRLAADVLSGEKLLIKFKSGEATQPALIAGAVRSECFFVSPMKP